MFIGLGIDFNCLFSDDYICFFINDMREDVFEYVVVLIVIYLELFDSFIKLDVIY